jgi:hypothetical protein
MGGRRWRWPSSDQTATPLKSVPSARAENRRKGLLSAPRAHTPAPYKTDLLWEALRARNRPGRGRTVGHIEEGILVFGLPAGL